MRADSPPPSQDSVMLSEAKHLDSPADETLRSAQGDNFGEDNDRGAPLRHRRTVGPSTPRPLGEGSGVRDVSKNNQSDPFPPNPKEGIVM